MGLLNGRKNLFDITASEKIVHDDVTDAVVNDMIYQITTVIKEIKKIVLTCYRAGCTITELTFYYDEDSFFMLTIWEGWLEISPFSADDIRLAHKEICLPDIADILILVVKLARHAGLSPSLSTDADSSSLLEFSS